MAGSGLRVIQFHHPGMQYQGSQLGPRKEPAGVMPWKPGRSVHNRKFMVSRGSVVDPVSGERQDGVEVGLWGEWEGPSRYTRIPQLEPGYPSAVHRPFRPTHPPESRQNTDPLVFGDQFLYSNCKQYRKAMQDLAPGSIVLFGRGGHVEGRPRFSLDTCFVVDGHDRVTLSPADLMPYWGGSGQRHGGGPAAC